MKPAELSRRYAGDATQRIVKELAITDPNQRKFIHEAIVACMNNLQMHAAISIPVPEKKRTEDPFDSCLCPEDWTDGTMYCKTCGKVR